MYSAEDILNGQVLLIDKPLTWSSFQAVNKLKYTLKNRLGLPKKFKIGHAGTLDPLATGLLIVCTGKFTKKITEIQAQTKEYTGTIVVGATTPSYDLETEIDATFPTEHITEKLIHDAVQQFLGEIDQKPPVFSAIKKDGVPMYKRARKAEKTGETITDLPMRTMQVFESELLKIESKGDRVVLTVRFAVSSGTYIRSLGEEIGQRLVYTATIQNLRRTQIGYFRIENARELKGE